MTAELLQQDIFEGSDENSEDANHLGLSTSDPMGFVDDEHGIHSIDNNDSPLQDNEDDDEEDNKKFTSNPDTSSYADDFDEDK